MRIAEVVAVYPPYKGGIGVVAHENARVLRDAGHTVTVFTPRYPKLKNLPPTTYHLSPITYHLSPAFAYGNAAILLQLVWRLKSADLIHFHYPFIGSALPVLLAAFLWRKPLLVTYHMDPIGKGLLGCIFSLYSRCIIPLVMKRASKIFVTSFDYANQSSLAHYAHATRKKWSELPIGVDTTSFMPREKDRKLCLRYGITKATNVLFFVGGMDRPHAFKGVDVLLRSYSLLRIRDSQVFQTTQLMLVGDGELRVQYESLAKELGIADAVRFLGALDGDSGDLSQHLSLAHVLILPSQSRSEAFGIVLIEAMASGVPVIATRLPGVRSVIEEGETGYLVDVGSVKDLTEKILMLLSHPSHAQSMSVRARERVLKRYSSLSVGKQLCEAVASFGETSTDRL